jgi:hypothetical protein
VVEMVEIMMETTPLAGLSPLSDRTIICNMVFDQIQTDRYNFFKCWRGGERGSSPTIAFFPRSQPKRFYIPFLRRNDNPATFFVCFSNDCIIVNSERYTGIRIIATIQYEDPNMIEQLSLVLTRLGISLPS